MDNREKCSYCGSERNRLEEVVCKHCGKVFWGDLLGPAIFFPSTFIMIGLGLFSKTTLGRGACLVIGGVLGILFLYRIGHAVIIEKPRIRASFDPCKSIIDHHEWTDWKQDDGKPCVQIRTCNRCQVTETRKVHKSFSDWEYIDDKSCIQTRTCRLGSCSEKEERVLHVWVVVGTETQKAWDSTNQPILLDYEDRKCIRDGVCERFLVDSRVDTGQNDSA